MQETRVIFQSSFISYFKTPVWDALLLDNDQFIPFANCKQKDIKNPLIYWQLSLISDFLSFWSHIYESSVFIFSALHLQRTSLISLYLPFLFVYLLCRYSVQLHKKCLCWYICVEHSLSSKTFSLHFLWLFFMTSNMVVLLGKFLQILFLTN